MRVVTGLAKGRKLTAPVGLQTRPTLEHVKEAVFSIIQFETEGSAFLDLFAGSGQIGIEALSRGARSCVFVDHSRDCGRIIEENLKKTGFLEKARIVAADAPTYLKSAPGPIDIAFIDPPHRKIGFEGILLSLSDIMSENGMAICESGKDETMPLSAGTLLKYREYFYGKTKVTVYRRALEE